MFRFLLIPLCIVFSLSLQACDQQGKQQAKIGVVNINRIMVDSDAGRAAGKYMEDMQDTLRKQLTALQATQSQGKDEKKADQEALQQEVQQAYAKLQAEQQNVQNILNDVLHRTVDNYRKANGYSMILFSDVVLSFEKSVDVTSEITQAMNQEKVEFKPLPEPKKEEAKPAPEDKNEQKSDAKAPESKGAASK